MGAVVFAGPTIRADRIRELLPGARVEPPAAQGDLFRAARRGAPAILLIDGYFERVPAVWHKEVLWAMAQGIPVFGAASMGALRAAELADFGMVGIGSVYESYVTGETTDDDEVAVIHGPRELGFPALSIAMVDIRATLAAAQAANVINSATAERMAAEAKSLYYPERNYAAIHAALAQDTAAATELSAFGDWRAVHGFSQKCRDAEAALLEVARRLDAGISPPEVRFDFAHTQVWNAFLQSLDDSPRTDTDATNEGVEPILNELRLDPALWVEARRAAEARATAIALAEATAGPPTSPELRYGAEAIRRDKGLEEAADLARWMARIDLDETGFLALVRGEVQAERGAERVTGEMAENLVAHLRVSGLYVKLAERASAKAKALCETSVRFAPHDAEALMGWFARTALNGAEGISAQLYAAETGFVTLDAFLQVLRDEYTYREGIRSNG